MNPDQKMSSALLCPMCKVGLTMSERQNIEIDYCPQCRGVWLDRGELDKIIERSLAERPPAPSEQRFDNGRNPNKARGFDTHGDHDRDQGHGYRRKSWLKEIFD